MVTLNTFCYIRCHTAPTEGVRKNVKDADLSFFGALSNDVEKIFGIAHLKGSKFEKGRVQSYPAPGIILSTTLIRSANLILSSRYLFVQC